MTRHDYGSALNPLSAPDHPSWAASVAADLDTLMIPGVIVAYGGSTAPAGWHLCDGTAHGSAELQAVIGSATTPDLRGKFILAASATHPAKQAGGAETHTLTITEMPSHIHGVNGVGTPNQDKSGLVGGGQGGWGIAGAENNNIYNPPGAQPTGGDAAHNNMPPFYALTYIVKK